MPVIVPEISSNVPTNTLDQMRPSTPLGIIVRYTTDLELQSSTSLKEDLDQDKNGGF